MHKSISMNFTLVVVFFTASLGVGCWAKVNTARHLSRANQYFDAGQYDQAEIEYTNVLRGESGNTQAISRLGEIYFEQGRFQRAVAYLQKVQELDPNNLEARLKLGRIYLVAGKPKEARDEAVFVLDKRPKDGEAPMLLAAAARTGQEVEETRQRLQKLSEATGDSAAFEVAMGDLLLKQHKLSAAEASFKRGQLLDPKSSSVHAALGALYMAQNDRQQAEQAFRTAAELSPPRSSRRLQYAQFKIQTGDPVTGRRLLEEMVQKTPDYLPSLLALTELSSSEKKYDECVALIRKILARDAMDFGALLLSGRLSLAKGETGKAIAELQKLTSLFPQSAAAHYQLGLAYLADNALVNSVSSLDKAARLDPNNDEARFLLAGLRIKSGEIGSAIEVLKQIVQRRPENAQAQTLLANAYRTQGRLDESLQIFRQLAGTYPRNPQYFCLIGELLLQQNKPDAAREEFGKALEMAPDYLPAVEGLVGLEIQAKQFAQASERIQKLLEKSSENPVALFLQARIFLAQNDTNRAEPVLLKIVKLQPGFRDARLTLARLYVGTSRHQKALENLNVLLVQNPKDTMALLLMGMIYQSEKNYESARTVYEKLLAADPKFGPAFNNLAWLYSEYFGLRDKAAEMARKARELLPSDPYTADTFGWILYKNGQYAEALDLLQESAEKLPTQPDIQYHLGMIRYMLGQEEATRGALELARQLKINPPERDEVDLCLGLLAIDAKTAGLMEQTRLEKRLTERPGDPIALTRLAAIYERDGVPGQAIGIYQKALVTDSKNAIAMAQLSRLYSKRSEDFPKAFDLAKSAHKLAPEDPTVSHILGRLAFQAGDFNWALSLLREAAQKRTKDPEVFYDLGEAEYSVGRLPEAARAMRQALEMGGSFTRDVNAKTFLDMTVLAADPVQALEAESRVEQLLKSTPDLVTALMVSAVISEQRADIGKAIQAYEKALRQYPDFVPAKKRLAILCAENTDDLGRIYSLAIKAREAFPDDPELAKALGMILYRRGDYATAVTPLKESGRIFTTDAKLQYYLGMALYKLHQTAESKQALQHALELNLSGDQLAEAKRVLTELK